MRYLAREIMTGESYFIFNHQGKADELVKALSTKYEQVDRRAAIIDFVLTDNDVTGRVSQLDRLRANGAKFFFTYPHSGRVNLYADMYDTWRHTTAQFVTSDGHAEIMREYGYKKPLHVIGWYLCPIRPFEATTGINVLFAPIHPRMADMDRRVNLDAYNRLMPLHKSGAIKLTIRYLPPFEQNGIPRDDAIRYVEGSLQPDWAGIDAADLVVAHQTFGYLAAARGKPLLGLGEHLPPHSLGVVSKIKTARNWDRYNHLVRYPFDISDYDDTAQIITRACAAGDETGAWRARMIGKSFDAGAFLGLIDNYMC